MTDIEQGAGPRVAYQGEPGAFSEEAATTFFAGRSIATLPMRDFAAVAEAVRNGAATHGVLPIENSIHGSVTGSYDVLAAGGLTIIGEVVRPIRLCLLGVAGASAEGVRRVISHPVALAQCGRYLGTLPDAVVEAVYDTAGAAQEVAARGDPTLAAVASRSAAACYGLTLLAEDIQDRSDNVTRFFLVTPRDRFAWPAGEDGSWKAVLLLEADHLAGSLVRMLLPFAQHGVNLTRIESRPADEVWSYRFFVELVTTDGIARLTSALEDLKPHARRVEVLGCFPATG